MSLSQFFRLMDAMARMSLRADATKFILGYIWWILEPLLYVGVLYVVFTLILSSRQADFLWFLMCGKLAFIWFSKSITQASNSIVSGKGLVGKINVPKTLFPMAVIQECLYKQAAVFSFLFVVLLAAGYPLTINWLYVVPVAVVNYIMIIALAFIGAFLVTMMRDFSPLIGLGMIFLMFTSGIFWNIRDLGDPAKTDFLLTINPLAFVLDAYRQALMYNTPPDLWHLLAIGLGFGSLALAMVIVMTRQSQFLALKALN
ncbi:MAG: ABC transporter [Pseudomonadota bacterium]